MQRINAPKGTQDILPAESWKWQTVERVAREVAGLYHFQEIRTPVFEHSELFHRGVGETSDFVRKETFTFDDRGGESLTLRPEGTAGVARAMIENGLLNDQGARHKVFYIGPNFRYERPQKGRYRQHHQFGAEAFGVAEPEQDAECIQLQMHFYHRCGLRDLELRINSLGDAESKARYRGALQNFLMPHCARLSDDSQRRLTENPLRILDSKDPRDIEACKEAPPAVLHLSDKSLTHFKRVVDLLINTVDLPFPIREDYTLVRGFDYYTETLWEVTAAGLGAQNAVGGGGRYDNLVTQLGGKPTPGVGFGSGLERLLIALDAQGVALPRDAQPLVWLVAHGDAARDANVRLLRDLRNAGISSDTDLSRRSVKAQFKLAEREHAAFAIVTGDDELAAGTVVLKDLAKREETTLPRNAVIDGLSARLKSS
ncbi:MAG: histidine--tRNA ligase [Thermoleophilaceae bacterium]|nr:histidine--tRNA ligase [Thermoleophilaceae bacterium]